jgi:putative ABC transport system permease protein
MRAFRLAWLTVVRQPGRSCLGILGVAAVGALLFDMLLLSRGLLVSFRDLLDRSGFDIRIMATDALPFSGPGIERASALTAALAALPEVEAVQQVRVTDAETAGDEKARRLEFIGADPRARTMWTIVEGRDIAGGGASAVVVNRRLARALNASPGSPLTLRGRCGEGETTSALTLTIAGIAEFPFDTAAANTAAGTLAAAARLCGRAADDTADLVMVRSRPAAGADVAAVAIRRARPDLHVVTSEDLVQQFNRTEFAYFRQISTVLAAVTLFFGFLLIAVLLTVSVNQHLGEIATLRAVGLTRRRIVSGIVWESAMLVGAGGILAIPLGTALSLWLDRILRAMPDVPADLHFFVFEPRALVVHVLLLAIAALAAAAYPVRIVSALPIAATLRRETVS